ncbi:MAG: hypothetical protein ACK4Y5_08660 [Acetobacteraceae bacterium]
MNRYLEGQASRSTLAEWATTRPGRRPPSNPPTSPCGFDSDSRVGFEVDDRADHQQADICALVALLRVRTGAKEWSELRLRTPLVHHERVTLLGLLWALAADRERGRSGFRAEDRFAPLNDLLLSQRQTPPSFQLAAQLLLRSVPDREAWKAITALAAQGADPVTFLVATRWMYRRPGDSAKWFADELVAMPPPRRAELLDILLNSVQLGLGEDQGTPLERLTRTASRQFNNELLNALMLASFVDKSRLAEAAERENLFARLQIPRLQNFSLERRAGYGGSLGSRRLLDDLRDLQDRLLQERGWTDAIVALETREATELPAQLSPTHEGRYGRLRIADGDIVELKGPEGAQITLFHPKTHQTMILRVNAPWPVRSSGPVTGDKDAWLFRAAMPTQGVRLEVRIPKPITLAREENDSRIPSLKIAEVYHVTELEARTPRFARIEGVKLGERLSITTSNLGPDVDTKVAVRDALNRWIEDDDGGDGFASRLDWIADQAGTVLLKIENIGRLGAFNILVTRQ